MKKEITYPIFLKLASIQEDTFWKYIYEDLSYGKCPYGIYIQNDYICSFIKGKEFSYHFDDKEEHLKEIINIIQFMMHKYYNKALNYIHFKVLKII